MIELNKDNDIIIDKKLVEDNHSDNDTEDENVQVDYIDMLQNLVPPPTPPPPPTTTTNTPSSNNNNNNNPVYIEVTTPNLNNIADRNY